MLPLGIANLLTVSCFAPAIGQGLTKVEGFLPGVPLKLSFKIFLDRSGNRSSSTLHALNTNNKIYDTVRQQNEVLARNGSELRLAATEIVDVPDVSGENQWFNACPTEDHSVIDNLAQTALNNPDFYWRNDALNVYIVGRECPTSQAGDIPGTPLTHTNIIMLAQNSWDTTLLHEVGHLLNLIHTFENDECNDIITDMHISHTRHLIRSWRLRHEKRFNVDEIAYRHCVKKLLVWYLVNVNTQRECYPTWKSR
jgi:hypothetical protein